jgi:roadblock/LC7 domain-containing protein
MFDIPAAIEAGSKMIDGIVRRIWPDATEVEKAKIEQFRAEMQAQHAALIAQLDINKTEASHASVFVAGWRPALGWVGAAGLFYEWVVRPIGTAVSVSLGGPVLTPLDIGDLITLVAGMLGLGGLRTAEKINGVARDRLK